MTYGSPGNRRPWARPRKGFDGRQKTPRESTLHEQTLTGQGERTNTHRSVNRCKNAQNRYAGNRRQRSAIPKGLQIPDIHFDFDSYTLNPANQEILEGRRTGLS